MKLIRLVIKYLKFNLSSQMEYRGNFILQVVGMIINDIFLLFFWWVIFSQIGSLKGFEMNDIFLMYSIVTVSFGISMTLFGNQNNISEIIFNGELDSYLLLPRPVLPHILISKISLSAIGDVIFGLILFLFSGYASLISFISFLILCFLSALLFAAISVIMHSLSLYFGNMARIALLVSDTLMTFSIYPQGVFTGIAKGLILTIIPAMYFVFIPMEIVKDFNLLYLFYVLIADFIFISLAFLLFYKGLNKYESGNLIMKRM